MTDIRSFEDKADLSPHSVEAEQQVLGAILLNNDLFDNVAGDLKSLHFYDPVHAMIYERITERINAGLIASPVTLGADLQDRVELEPLGGRAYLIRLAGSATSSFAIADYARTISDLAAKRALVKHMDMARERIVDGGMSGTEVALKLEAGCGNLISKTSVKPLIRSIMSTATSALEYINSAYRGGTPPGISTGIQALDRAVGSFRPSDFVLIAGRPAMGKSSVALNITAHAAENGIGVFHGSLEMPAEQLFMRLQSRELSKRGIRLPYSSLMNGRLSEDEFRTMVEASRRVAELPIEFGERDVREVARFRAAVRRAKQKFADATPLGLIVVDYVQQMQVEGVTRIFDRVSHVSDALKSLAMEFNIPVVGMAQLNRSVEMRDPPIPTLSDLRESGKLEEDTDMVMFCYRHAYYLQKNLDALPSDDMDTRADLEAMIARQKYEIDLIIDKNRHGPTAKVKTFMEMATCHMDANPRAFERQPEMEYEA